VRRLRVGLDLDGVNFWFDQGYHRGCLELGLIPAKTAAADATYWEFYELYGHDLATFLSNCNTLADAGLLWSGPMIPGAAPMWDSLVDAGHEIHVITDRSFGSHPVASEVGTRMWLAQHRRIYHSLRFDADKTVVPTDVMLEDKLSNYDALAATDCVPVLINRPWNQVEGGDARRRIDHHEEFLPICETVAENLGLAA
jgi:hypothetical protein